MQDAAEVKVERALAAALDALGGGAPKCGCCTDGSLTAQAEAPAAHTSLDGDGGVDLAKVGNRQRSSGACPWHSARGSETPHLSKRQDRCRGCRYDSEECVHSFCRRRIDLPPVS